MAYYYTPTAAARTPMMVHYPARSPFRTTNSYYRGNCQSHPTIMCIAHHSTLVHDHGHHQHSSTLFREPHMAQLLLRGNLLDSHQAFPESRCLLVGLTKQTVVRRQCTIATLRCMRSNIGAPDQGYGCGRDCCPPTFVTRLLGLIKPNVANMSSHSLALFAYSE